MTETAEHSRRRTSGNMVTEADLPYKSSQQSTTSTGHVKRRSSRSAQGMNNTLSSVAKRKKLSRKSIGQKEQQQLDAMLHGAQQWNKQPHKHQFRERQRAKELSQKEFVPGKLIKRSNVPHHTGTFTSKAKDTAIKTRAFRESITNVAETTQSQFYLRTRHRNIERQNPIVRTSAAKDDASRVQEAIDSRWPVEFEPFNAKAFMNHKFRDEQPVKWRNSLDFNRSMKAPSMGQKEQLMHQLGTAEPYQNSLDHLGNSLMIRKRLPKKEMSPSRFNQHVRPQSREQAFSRTAVVGTIRQQVNEQTRDLLKKYQKDGDYPSEINENASYMKGTTTVNNTLLDALQNKENLTGPMLSVTNVYQFSSPNEMVTESGENTGLNKSLDVISESKGLRGSSQFSNPGATSHERLPTMISQQTFQGKDKPSFDPVIFNSAGLPDQKGGQNMRIDDENAMESASQTQNHSFYQLVRNSNQRVTSVNRTKDSELLDHIGQVKLKSRKGSPDRKQARDLHISPDTSPLGNQKTAPTIESSSSRFYPNSNKVALSQLRRKQNMQTAQTLQETWDAKGHNIRTSATAERAKQLAPNVKGRHSQLCSYTPNTPIQGKNGASIGHNFPARQSMETLELKTLNFNPPGARTSQNQISSGTASQYGARTEIQKQPITHSSVAYPLENTYGKKTENDVVARLQKTQSQRQIEKVYAEGPPSPFGVRPQSKLKGMEQGSRPISSNMQCKRIYGNTRIITNKRDQKRNEVMTACRSDNKMFATKGGRPVGGEPYLVSESSAVAITTQLNRAKNTDASTQQSRPQSGKASLLGRRQMNAISSTGNSNALFNIELNDSTKVAQQIDASPIKIRATTPVPDAESFGQGQKQRPQFLRADNNSSKQIFGNRQLNRGGASQQELNRCRSVIRHMTEQQQIKRAKLLSSSYMRAGLKQREASQITLGGRNLDAADKQ